MIVIPARVEHAAVQPGHYAIWAGADLRAELPAVIALLRAMSDGASVSAAIQSEPSPTARWAGDPLAPDPTPVDRGGLLTLRTSGTTGAPKEVAVDVPAAVARKRGGQAGERWLLAYAPWRWAGISVLLHCLRFESELVIPRTLDPGDVLEAGREFAATHLSLTPSLFRMLRVGAPDAALGAIPLRQVTFGGESASAAVLAAAREIWPAARITHTYAATEFGDICAVSDGLEGVPAGKFARFELSAAGELLIEGRGTGDLWERRGDRYYFAGRVEEMINVGGAKVSPIAVEDAALAVPGVRVARAHAIPSPVVGQLVALDYVGDIGERDLRDTLRAALPRVACPAVVVRRDTIELSAAGKLRRLG